MRVSTEVSWRSARPENMTRHGTARTAMLRMRSAVSASGLSRPIFAKTDPHPRTQQPEAPHRTRTFNHAPDLGKTCALDRVYPHLPLNSSQWRFLACRTVEHGRRREGGDSMAKSALVLGGLGLWGSTP